MAGFNIMDILNAKTNAAAEVEEFEAINLNYADIVVTDHNKYSMDEINDLATGIHMAGGLQQPLVLGKVEGEYRLVSGHRRLEAIKILVSEGEEEFAEVDCRYKTMTETEFRMQLLIGNTFNRKMTDYDRMQQAKRDGTFKPEKGTRTRDYIAQIMGVSAATIGELERINHNATDEVKEQLKEGNITMTAAAAASTLPEEDQNDIAEAAAAGQDIRAEEIQQLAKEKQEEHCRSTLEQMKESVSDTDTTEEEKENAKRLHVLKMLEKYYIYMNDDDLRCLEAMLEDCKRRKREYSLDDCGSTAEE